MSQPNNASKPACPYCGDIRGITHPSPCPSAQPATPSESWREWWILPDGQTLEFEPQHFTSTHVVERAALTTAEAEREFYKSAGIQCSQTIERLEREMLEQRQRADALQAELSNENHASEALASERDNWRRMAEELALAVELERQAGHLELPLEQALAKYEALKGEK